MRHFFGPVIPFFWERSENQNSGAVGSLKRRGQTPVIWGQRDDMAGLWPRLPQRVAVL